MSGRLGLGMLAAALLCMMAAAIAIGAVTLSPGCLLSAITPLPSLLSCSDLELARAMLALRAPRVLLGVIVGSSLGASGALTQSLFRNPLAEPGLLGVSSGAALAAAAITVLAGPSWAAPPYLILGAFVGGTAAVVLVRLLAQVDERIAVATLLLSGVAVSALAGALLGLLMFIASDAQLRNLTFWSLGSLGGATWPRLWSAAPAFLLGGLLLHGLSRPLNALLLGESEAAHLGIEVEAIKRRALLGAVLLVAASVALCGAIGFVGLIVPHLARLLLGCDHRRAIPAAALLGATLLTAADLAARVVVRPAELPLGVVTAALGGPFFVGLLTRERRRIAAGEL